MRGFTVAYQHMSNIALPDACLGSRSYCIKEPLQAMTKSAGAGRGLRARGECGAKAGARGAPKLAATRTTLSSVGGERVSRRTCASAGTVVGMGVIGWPGGVEGAPSHSTGLLRPSSDSPALR